MAERPRYVRKFGGASLATDDQLATVARFIARNAKDGKQEIVVPSARGNETDELVATSREINPNASGATRDFLVSSGEVKAAGLLAHYIEAAGAKVTLLDVHQLGMLTTGEYERARIKTVQHPGVIEQALDAGNVVIIPGFQGITETGAVVTLGRGGADLSAGVIAAVTKAECFFYKDVRGVCAADPRLVENARCFRTITLEQMRSLCEWGAGVLMLRAVQVAMAHAVTLHVRLSPSVGEGRGGTMVVPGSSHADFEGSGFAPLVALTTQCGLARVAVRNVPDELGQLAKISSAFKGLDFVRQLQDDGRGTISTVVHLVKKSDAQTTAERIRKDHGLPVDVEDGLAELLLINPYANDPDALATRASAIADAKVNIRMSQSIGNVIMTLVSDTDLPKAANALALRFGLIEPAKSRDAGDASE